MFETSRLCCYYLYSYIIYTTPCVGWCLVVLYIQLPMLDGVLSFSDAHFWLHSSESIAGTIHIQVAPSVNEQKVNAMVTNYLKSELGVSTLTLQVEKECYSHCGITQSYVKQLQQTTPPQVYVDYGPHAGQIKSV